MGQHQVVIKLLQSIYYLRPPKPKYAHTWDVNLVLSFLSSLGSNEDLDLKAISRKLTILLALSNNKSFNKIILNILNKFIRISKTDFQFLKIILGNLIKLF